MGKRFGKWEAGPGWEPPSCRPELVMIQQHIGDTSAGPVKKQRILVSSCTLGTLGETAVNSPSPSNVISPLATGDQCCRRRR
jgi:hypothetical protein